MTIEISQIYQKRKIVYIYLDANEEIQNLKKQVGDKVLLYLGTWQMWGERPVEEAWKNKTHDWIIWPHQTSRLNRWVVLVINVKDDKSAIHTASQDTEHAKAEKNEIENFLGGLKDFNFGDENPVLDTDDGLNKKDELGSAHLAICYVKTVLEQLNKGTYAYDINSSDFDELGEDGKSLAKKVEGEYDSILTQVKKLTKLEELEKQLNQLKVENELRTEKEKYKTKRKDDKSWTLTASEKNRIDQTTNKEDLEKVVGDIMQERDAAEKVDNWIKENISSKDKLEDLPKETDIDNNAELPSSAKEKVKWKLREKVISLMPTTTTEEKIKKHLTEVLNDWRKWEYLFDNGKEDDKDYTLASMFNQSFRGTVAKEMEPEIEAAIKVNTLEGYRELDRKWGQAKKEGEVEYNVNREYLEAWKTLREYLQSDKIGKDKWMETYLKGFYGNDKFQKDEQLYQWLQAQIEVLTKE